MRQLVMVAAFQSACLAAVATASDVVANFDSFAEGPIGFEFTDGGIRFSDLDLALSDGPFQFISEDASFNPYPTESTPNILGFVGYVPGPGSGLGRFRSMTITFPDYATSATLDAFSSRTFNHKILKLSAYMDNALVATTSIFVDQGTVIRPAVVYDPLSINAPSFNRLTLLATTADGTPDFTTIAFDNVKASLAPEPSALLLLVTVCASAFLTRRCRSGFPVKAHCGRP